MNHQSNWHPDTTADAYKKLTGIDVAAAQYINDPRGKGYYGEFLLFSVLYRHLPGTCKILMNLQIPAYYGHATELDLVLIHETGLYVFEAKHYKGTIYGQTHEEYWTQYFRTAPNQRFRNPVQQNAFHIENLRRLFPNIPIHSFIVFTNDDCDTSRIETKKEGMTICALHQLSDMFLRLAHAKPAVLNMDQIDNIFTALKVYSPITNYDLTVDQDKKLNFYDFVEMVRKHYSSTMEAARKHFASIERSCKENFASAEKNNKRKWRNNTIVSVCSAFVICLFVCMALTANFQRTSEVTAQAQEAQEIANAKTAEAESFLSKWQVVENTEATNAGVRDGFILVDELILEDSPDLESVVKFGCTLSHHGTDHYAVFNKNSSVIVVLDDGTVWEYPIFDSPYSASYLGRDEYKKTATIKNWEFQGFTTEQIRYIKLVGITVNKLNDPYAKSASTDFEIELYRKADQ